MANDSEVKPKKLPKMPSMFGKGSSQFGPNSLRVAKTFSGKGFVPQIRTTQSKGAGGK